MAATIKVVLKDAAGDAHEVALLDEGQSDEDAGASAVANVAAWATEGTVEFSEPLTVLSVQREVTE